MFKWAILWGIVAVVCSVGAFSDFLNMKALVRERLEKESVALEQAPKDPDSINKNFSFVKRGTVKENGKTYNVSVYKGDTAYVVIKEMEADSEGEKKTQVSIYKKGSDDLTAVNLIKQL